MFADDRMSVAGKRSTCFPQFFVTVTHLQAEEKMTFSEKFPEQPLLPCLINVFQKTQGNIRYANAVNTFIILKFEMF